MKSSFLRRIPSTGIFLTIFCSIFSIEAIAQDNLFEGVIKYHTTMKFDCDSCSFLHDGAVSGTDTLTIQLHGDMARFDLKNQTAYGVYFHRQKKMYHVDCEESELSMYQCDAISAEEGNYAPSCTTSNRIARDTIIMGWACKVIRLYSACGWEEFTYSDSLPRTYPLGNIYEINCPPKYPTEVDSILNGRMLLKYAYSLNFMGRVSYSCSLISFEPKNIDADVFALPKPKLFNKNGTPMPYHLTLWRIKCKN